MMFVIVEDNIVSTINVDNSIFIGAIESPDDILSGDMYADGEFKKVAPRPTPVILSPSELRKFEYGVHKCILWETESITVDDANKIYLEYLAEGSVKASEIQLLIISAKEYIRSLYPDTEV